MEPQISSCEVNSSTFCDLEALFGPSGAYYGCWCMYRRVKKQVFQASSPEQRKLMMTEIVDSGNVPGLILYENGQPAGWVSIAPVEQFDGLFSSHFRKPREATGLWTISCMFVQRKYRGKGHMDRLMDMAVGYARSNGAAGILAFPVVVHEKMDPALLYTGKASVFEKHGFVEVDPSGKMKKSSRKRKVMILSLKK